MIRAFLLAAAVLAAGPALAQTAPAPVETTAPPPSADQLAFQARADAFGGMIQTMAQEMQDAVTAAGADTARRDADLDAVEARYQPQVDEFIAALETFVAGQAAGMPADQAEGMRAGMTTALPRIRSVIPTVRAQIEQGADAPAPAAAPEAPAVAPPAQ